jgi:WD40 repeat protein
LGTLFISHSSKDNEAAITLRNWLKQNGWGQSFLDLDPQHGLAPGQRWQRELKEAGERCSAVILLVSPNWVASPWCQKEFELGHHLGKKIFPVFIASTPHADLPAEIMEYQFADVSGNEAEGLARLAIGLKRAGLDPNDFDWPPQGDPQRAIYRGLQSLDEEDAPIFFGRGALITKGLDTLRRMRDGAPERFLVILGASGAGKSSFLKAGLIARLKRDEENFLVLPLVRPERAALTGERGLAASLSRDGRSSSGPEDIVQTLAERRAGVMERLAWLAESAHESTVHKPPTVVVAIDQAEELFQAENTEAPRMLELLAAAMRADRNLIVVAAIRSDTFEKLQSSTMLEDVPRLPFDLPPLSHAAFKEVIEGPAHLASPPCAPEPALTERLLKELGTGDALPLLAFTLERLWTRPGRRSTLTLAEYVDEMGGLQGAIVSAVEAAFAAASRDPSLPQDRAEIEKLARAAFIPALVQLNDADSEPRRRIERMSALPLATRGLVQHLVNQRLLVSDRSMVDGDATETVEVAHEAILRQWPALKSWIAQERDALRALDGVRAAATEWRTHADRRNQTQGQGWLAHRGGRLEEAEALSRRADFANALSQNEREYLSACRSSEDADRQREKRSIARTRRFQRIAGALIAVTAAAVLSAGFGIERIFADFSVRASNALTTRAAKESASGNYELAAREALAALVVGNQPLTNYDSSRVEAELRGASIALSSLAVLRGHQDALWSAVFSPDGKRILTSSWDNTARIWDRVTGTSIAVLRGPDGKIWTAAFSPDGKRIGIGCDDGSAPIYDAATLKQVAVLRGHTDSVVSIAFSPDGKRILTGSGDNTARIWDANTAQEIAVLRGHGGAVWHASFSPDGTRIVTGSGDKTARIWDASTARQVAVLSGHEDGLNDAAFSPDGKRIVTASLDKTARIWDAATGSQIIVLRGHESTVQSAVFSPDGKRIVTASWDKTARLWDAATGSPIAVRRGHEDRVNSAAFSPDGKQIVTASYDKSARIWDATTTRDVAVLRGHEDAIFSAAFSPDGRRIATASNDATARIWDASTSGQIAVLRGHEGPLSSVAFSSDGKKVVTSSDDGTARVWNPETGAQLTLLRGHASKLDDAEFSPDGTRIATASDDITARIWDAGTARQLGILKGHGIRVDSADFSPDGARVVTASDDKTARIWDANAFRTIAILRGHTDVIGTAMFSRDGARIVTASGDGTARIWDANTTREITRVRSADGAFTGAAFDPDGKHFVTAGTDATARVWDTSSGAPIAVLRGHSEALGSAAYNGDGTRIVTGSRDKTARIWNVSGMIGASGNDLMRLTCEGPLAHGLSLFTDSELREAPELDPRLDGDPCRPPSLWERLFAALEASFRH